MSTSRQVANLTFGPGRQAAWGRQTLWVFVASLSLHHLGPLVKCRTRRKMLTLPTLSFDR